ncbi:hypothetical protein [Niallia sp. NCCP-28]|uniref:hypothetical protein n=1 Tax=Niallia sp. NCCP-28 TaxID=2934712 RepID=UPI002082E031|nr:hypothetical protein [Niallia sp. NCCP-28]GKU85316.1 hypothetical protein NCCP28_47120 [Niallia sp. NCCP-28]
MKRKAVVGEFVIDRAGFRYQVEEVFEKSVSVGNGEYLMHTDYQVIPESVLTTLSVLEKEFSNLVESMGGLENAQEVFLNLVNRQMYLEDYPKKNPREMYTFNVFEG